MPSKKGGGFGRKSKIAKFMQNFRKNLTPKEKEKLQKSTKSLFKNIETRLNTIQSNDAWN